MEKLVRGFISVILSCLVIVGIFIMLNMVSYAIIGGCLIAGLLFIGSAIHSCFTRNEI